MSLLMSLPVARSCSMSSWACGTCSRPSWTRSTGNAGRPRPRRGFPGRPPEAGRRRRRSSPPGAHTLRQVLVRGEVPHRPLVGQAGTEAGRAMHAHRAQSVGQGRRADEVKGGVDAVRVQPATAGATSLVSSRGWWTAPWRRAMWRARRRPGTPSGLPRGEPCDSCLARIWNSARPNDQSCRRDDRPDG
jgi:hypothetical protein